jgi:hypothetical protein
LQKQSKLRELPPAPAPERLEMQLRLSDGTQVKWVIDNRFERLEGSL